MNKTIYIILISLTLLFVGCEQKINLNGYDETQIHLKFNAYCDKYNGVYSTPLVESDPKHITKECVIGNWTTLIHYDTLTGIAYIDRFNNLKVACEDEIVRLENKH